jgi:putative SOS response-associated peptidase YedK
VNVAGIIGVRAEDMEQVDALQRAKLDWPLGLPMIRPSVKAPVLVKKDKRVDFVPARFGFSYRFSSINARVEKLQESPLWRSKFGKSHCVVPLSYVIEWVEKAGGRTPYLIQRRDRRLWMAPALFGHHHEDKEVAAFAICTREPNRFFGSFHDRMVGALTPALMDRWLEPEAHSKEDLLECIRAPAEEELEAQPTTPEITKRKTGDWSALPSVGDPIRWEDLPLSRNP